MAVLKYPFYIACVIFAVLTVYSVSTEKPRQFKAKAVDEAIAPIATKPMSDLWNADETIASAFAPSTTHTTKGGAQKPTESAKGNSIPQTATAQSSNSVVVGYSNNDAGGKIVLTLNKCEKAVGTVAYTTAPDGKVDYGCWTFDELYIVINWDKAGVNNYTYDRFLEINTNERLTSKLLFTAQHNQISTLVTPVTPVTPAPPSTLVAGTPVVASTNTTKTPGGKK